MTDIELKLRREERNHRDGIPAQRRDVADLLLAAADEIESLRSRVVDLEYVADLAEGAGLIRRTDLASSK